MIVTAANAKHKVFLQRLIGSLEKFGYEYQVYDLGGLGFGIPYETSESDLAEVMPDASFKPKVVLDAFKKFGKVIWIDSDAYLVDRIDDFKGNAVTIRKEKDTDERCRWINSGVVSVETLEFAEAWVAETNAVGGDQLALNNLYDKGGLYTYPCEVYNNFYKDKSKAKIIHEKGNEKYARIHSDNK
jgi:hypothetical protein